MNENSRPVANADRGSDMTESIGSYIIDLHIEELPVGGALCHPRILAGPCGLEVTEEALEEIKHKSYFEGLDPQCAAENALGALRATLERWTDENRHGLAEV
jgi:hypothetical protein